MPCVRVMYRAMLRRTVLGAEPTSLHEAAWQLTGSESTNPERPTRQSNGQEKAVQGQESVQSQIPEKNAGREEKTRRQEKAPRQEKGQIERRAKEKAGRQEKARSEEVGPSPQANGQKSPPGQSQAGPKADPDAATSTGAGPRPCTILPADKRASFRSANTADSAASRNQRRTALRRPGTLVNAVRGVGWGKGGVGGDDTLRVWGSV
jgi:hypothetical protein